MEGKEYLEKWARLLDLLRKEFPERSEEAIRILAERLARSNSRTARLLLEGKELAEHEKIDLEIEIGKIEEGLKRPGWIREIVDREGEGLEENHKRVLEELIKKHMPRLQARFMASSPEEAVAEAVKAHSMTMKELEKAGWKRGERKEIMNKILANEYLFKDPSQARKELEKWISVIKTAKEIMNRQRINRKQAISVAMKNWEERKKVRRPRA